MRLINVSRSIFDPFAPHFIISASASDSASFTDTADEHAIRHWSVSTSDSATFTGAAATTAKVNVSAASSATFTGAASSLYEDATSAHDLGQFADHALGFSIGVKHVSASDSFYFWAQTAKGRSNRVKVFASDTATFTEKLKHTGLFNYRVDAADYIRFREVAEPQFKLFARLVFASDSATFTDVASQSTPQTYDALASDSATFADTSGNGGLFTRSVSASDRAIFIGTARKSGAFLYGAKASDSARFRDSAAVSNTFAKNGLTGDGARFTDEADATRILLVSASDSATFTGVAPRSGRFHVSTSDSATFSDATLTPRHPHASQRSSAIFTDIASCTLALIGWHDVARFTDRADAVAVLPNEGGGGLLLVLASVSGDFPLSYAESADGTLLMANGLDPMLAWDGVSALAWQAGLVAPDTVVWQAATGTGLLTGVRYAFVRWLDERGNVSNLSPVSDPVDLGTDGLIGAVAYDSNGVVTVTSKDHGLSSGNVVIVSGVGGLTLANGQYAITVVGDDSFTLDGLTAKVGSYTSGGVWTFGSASITYSHVAVPTDAKVVRRQILRNLQGNANVFYVDVDTTDMVSTTFSSSATDEQLAARLAVPLQFDDKSPASNRFYPPPAHKKAVAAYAGRIFAASDLVYKVGNVQVNLGSQVVQGVGTAWTEAMVGRLLYVEGSSSGQLISAVMVPQQMLALEVPYRGTSNPIAFYTIRPAPVERRLVYYSEPNLPEAWPPWNAFAVPESSDEITGIMVMKSFLYILKERNIYKFAFREDPGKDGYIFPVAVRGCVNNRCYSYVEGKYYLLDESGIYAFDGDTADPISSPIQVIFKPDGATQYRIDWSSDRTLWSCAHDQSREIVRWFVDFVGREPLTHAICYDYRHQSWWLEQYAEPITASGLSVVSGYRQAVNGTTARRVLLPSQGSLDVITDRTPGTLQGVVTSSDSISLTDSSAVFAVGMAGVPVTVTDSYGSIQQGVISSNTSTTLTVVKPWIVPVGSSYQVGGVAWTWKSGWRSIAEDEAENPRDLEFVFAPTQANSTFLVSLFYDHSVTPYDGWGLDQNRDGISITSGAGSLEVSLNTPRGYARQRLSGHQDPYGFGSRYVSVQLAGVQSAEATRLYQLTVEGAS